MKNIIIFALFLWAGVSNATTAFEPYVVRNEWRSAEETIRQLEVSKNLYEFDTLLQACTPYHFGQLLKAAEDGVLVTRKCGDCFLKTAGLLNGRSQFHRFVGKNDLVTYLRGIPVFLPACANPVCSPDREARGTPLPPPPVAPTPVAEPTPVQPPAAPVAETPQRPFEGCTLGQVVITPERYDLPAIIVGGWGFWSPYWVFDPGSYTVTKSSHNWRCIYNQGNDGGEQ